VAARGYGVALAAFIIGWYQLTCGSIREGTIRRRRWIAASVALGLGVCAQLAFLFPVVALIASTLAVDAMWDLSRRHERSGRLREALSWMSIPGATVAAAILAVPLCHARRSHFEFGTWDLRETVWSLVDPSFRMGEDPIAEWLMWVCVAGGAASLVVAAAPLFTRSRRAPNSARAPHEVVLLTGIGTMILTLLIVIAARVFVGLKYPLARTALYFLPLAALTLSAAAQSLLTRTGLARGAGRLLTAGLVLVAARFAVELKTTHFYEWRFDAGSRAIYERIVQSPGRPGTGWRVASVDIYEPALTFYRVTRDAGAIQPLPSDWDGIDTEYDFFVVPFGPAVERLRAVADPIYRHPVSDAVLMARRWKRD
jgi:hypothetical protein